MVDGDVVAEVNIELLERTSGSRVQAAVPRKTNMAAVGQNYAALVTATAGGTILCVTQLGISHVSVALARLILTPVFGSEEEIKIGEEEVKFILRTCETNSNT